MRRGSLIVCVAAILLLSACGDDDSPQPAETTGPAGGGAVAQELVDLYVSIGYSQDLAQCYAEAYGADGSGVDTQDELNALINSKGASHLAALAACDVEFGG